MNRIESLTSLRFVAALIVVIYHYGRDTGIAEYTGRILIAGPQMATLFFVLSGFVMTVAYYSKDTESLNNYWAARIARILPVYILALFLSVYLFNGKENNNLTAFLLSLTFLQSWFPPYPLSFNLPAWSLSVEAFFYLTFPFVLFAIKKSDISWKSLAILSLFVYLFTQAILSNVLSIEFYDGYPSASHDLIYYFPLSHYCSFFLGVSGGYIYSKHPEWFNRAGFLPLVILIAAILVNGLFLQRPDILTRFIGFSLAYGSSFYSLFFLLLILSLAFSKNILTKIMSSPVLVLLGESSYSLYILQLPAHGLFAKYLSPHLSTTPDGEFYIFIVLLVIVSIASFYFIEKPGKRLILNFYSYMKGVKENG
jgi:peptidoglycan/LPS O-acetylase OafA/YrhL